MAECSCVTSKTRKYRTGKFDGNPAAIILVSSSPSYKEQNRSCVVLASTRTCVNRPIIDIKGNSYIVCLRISRWFTIFSILKRAVVYHNILTRSQYLLKTSNVVRNRIAIALIMKYCCPLSLTFGKFTFILKLTSQKWFLPNAARLRAWDVLLISWKIDVLL